MFLAKSAYQYEIRASLFKRTGNHLTLLFASNVPVTVVGLPDADTLGLGYLHSCAIHSDGTGLKCWGDIRSEQLGVEDISISPTPVEMWLYETARMFIALVE